MATCSCSKRLFPALRPAPSANRKAWEQRAAKRMAWKFPVAFRYARLLRRRMVRRFDLLSSLSLAPAGVCAAAAGALFQQFTAFTIAGLMLFRIIPIPLVLPSFSMRRRARAQRAAGAIGANANFNFPIVTNEEEIVRGRGIPVPRPFSM